MSCCRLSCLLSLLLSSSHFCRLFTQLSSSPLIIYHLNLASRTLSAIHSTPSDLLMTSFISHPSEKLQVSTAVLYNHASSHFVSFSNPLLRIPISSLTFTFSCILPLESIIAILASNNTPVNTCPPLPSCLSCSSNHVHIITCTRGVVAHW